MNINRKDIPYNYSGILLNIPEIEYSTFGNIKIYKYQDNSQPLVNFKVNFKNGAAADNIPGVANYTMSMLQSGTKNLSAGEVSEKFESLGASYFFNAYWDESSAGFSAMENFFEPCFDTIVECIFNPAFDDAEISRQRDRISAGIMHNSADPNYIAQVAFNKGIYRNHPYGNPRTGGLSDVAQITKKDIVDFYDLLISKSEISIIITGNFDNDYIDKLIESKFQGVMNNSGQINIPDYVASNLVNVIAGKDDAMQTNLRIGRQSIDRKNPDYPAFQVVNTIFGGYFLSRLNHVLRETKGLTYGIHSYLDMRQHGNVFTISTSINAEKTLESIKDIFEISMNMSIEKLEKSEIERSIEFMTGSFARSLETPKQITGIIQTLDSFELDTDFLRKFYRDLRLLTIDEIFEVQKKYFSDTNYMIAATGNADFLSTAISEFGEFEILEIS
ncbi:MAG: insulinase family protein [Candidatus Kapabacteria bacterium]|nr:insulinase family protein [Ignavibacteriota bacterium]MCW5885423.1 insulinase family protein [Candidatus Kapabacteria bacterium]